LAHFSRGQTFQTLLLRPNCTKFGENVAPSELQQISIDVNNDKFENPRPRTCASQMSRPKLRTLLPQRLFKDFCQLNVESFTVLDFLCRPKIYK